MERLALELAPGLYWVYPVIGRAWIESGARLGRLPEAATTRDELLRLRPHDPRALLEAGLFESAAGEHLEEALAVWAEADAEFEPALEARRELERLVY